MSIVDAADHLAAKYHISQTRWDGSPYIAHPRAVGRNAENQWIFDGRPKQYAHYLHVLGLLHDAPEDHGIKESDLIEEIYSLIEVSELDLVFKPILIEALKRLNKHHYKDYDEFIAASLGQIFSAYVKREDIKHNLSDLKPGKLRNKYEKALIRLDAVLKTPTIF